MLVSYLVLWAQSTTSKIGVSKLLGALNPVNRIKDWWSQSKIFFFLKKKKSSVAWYLGMLSKIWTPFVTEICLKSSFNSTGQYSTTCRSDWKLVRPNLWEAWHRAMRGTLYSFLTLKQAKRSFYCPCKAHKEISHLLHARNSAFWFFQLHFHQSSSVVRWWTYDMKGDSDFHFIWWIVTGPDTNFAFGWDNMKTESTRTRTPISVSSVVVPVLIARRTASSSAIPK